MSLFEEIVDQIGWGRYQIRNTVFCHIISGLMAIHVLSPIFIAYPLPYSCNPNSKQQAELICDMTLNENQTSLFIPTKIDTTELNHCKEYSYTLSPLVSSNTCTFWDHERTPNLTIDCTEFVFTNDGTVQSSIFAKYEMICNKSWYNYLLQSLFMVGVFTNGLVFGKASDRIGRKQVLLIMSIGTIILSFVIAFANSFPLYAALRTMVGFFCFPGPTTLVLSTETTRTNRRAIMTNVVSFGFSTGTIVLVLFAYFVKHWQTLQVVSSLTFSGCLVFWWLFDESPRWLVSRGRGEEAYEILEKISKVNKVGTAESLVTLKDNLLNKSSNVSKPSNFGMTDTLRTPQLRKLTLVMTYTWFATSCAFYGLTLNVSMVGGNIYLTTLLMGLMAFPAYPLGLYLCQKVGRRFVISSTFLLAGLFCFSMYLIPSDLKALHITMFLMGRVCTLIPFCTLYLYAIELNPTVIRSTAVNYGSSLARVGAIVAPAIAMTKLVHPTLPFIMFGFITIFAGFLILLLPETRKASMFETLEETEEFMADNIGPLERLICGRKSTIKL